MTADEGQTVPADTTGEGATVPVAGSRGLSRFATYDSVVALLLAIIGLRLGLDSLHDNSFFTHLATGRIILDTGSIPRRDPYSFTAPGHAWVVQSWGASVIYAGIDRWFGLVGIRVLVGACTTGLALLAWRLTRPAERLVGRLAIVVPAMAVGASMWVERPLLFGMLFLGAALLAAEDQLDPRWLVPVMYLWVNVHGSFPLGLVALGTLGVGRLLDRERPFAELRSLAEVRSLAWAVLGCVLAVANPLGWRLLAFPIDLLSRREAFSRIAEWQPPEWQNWGERAFALQLALAVALFLLRGRSWRLAVPTLVFGGLALMSTRNIVQASLVLVPVMASQVRGLGSIDGRVRARLLRPVVAALAVLALLVGVIGLQAPDLDLVDYPVASTTWMERNDLLGTDARIVHRDFVGNYLEAAYGPDEVRVFLDDRVDMYPLEVIDDYLALLDDGADFAAVLDRARATAVLWDVDSPFGRWLVDSDAWDVVHESSDDVWIVAVPAR